jgi:NADH dehydrogenase [ubiquinone] 1 alpha subcomplex assembly factor 1
MAASIRSRSASVLPDMTVRIIALLTALLYAGSAMTSSATPQEAAIKPLISFESAAEARAWRTVNDNVMGGRSQGGGVVEKGQLVFTGSINTNGGGFSSVRRDMEPGALEGIRAFILSIRSDGRGYKLTARTNTRFRGQYVSYQADIPASPEGQWSNVRVAFSDFVPSVFGNIVPVSEISPAEVNEIGFIIADGVDGDFALSVRSISIER